MKPHPPGDWPTIRRVMYHALGSNEAIYNHWVNWLAFVFQHRTLTGASWIFQGVQGTGKGVLQNLILAPLFGHQNVSFALMHNLDAGWTDFLEDKLLCCVDEMHLEGTTQASKAMALIKNFITEPRIVSRRKYMNSVLRDNHENLIFFSNMPNPIEVSQSDRRFNVGIFQENKIEFTALDADNIALELQHFAEYLRTYQVDLHKARTPLITEALPKPKCNPTDLSDT